MQIQFNEVRGYANRANAEKSGQAVEDVILARYPKLHSSDVRWVVLQNPKTGRWIPAFLCTDKVGPHNFLSLTNVCSFN